MNPYTESYLVPKQIQALTVSTVVNGGKFQAHAMTLNLNLLIDHVD